MEDKKYSTNILVSATDNKNVLIDIITKTSSSNVVLQSINSINTNEDYMFDIAILVPDKEKLMKFINDISALKNIKSVYFIKN